MKAVFDASALLAILNLEPGAERARALLPNALISAVNAAEVAAKLLEGGMSEDAVRNSLRLLRVKITDFDAVLADHTARLRESTRRHGLSLADRACLALALREGAAAITADRAWSDLDVGCEIELIR